MIERMNLDTWLGLKLSPAELKRLGLRAAFKVGLKKDWPELMKALATDGKQALMVTASEVGEEILQGANKQGVLEYAKGRVLLDAYLNDRTFQAAADAFVEALPTCTAFGVFGAADVRGAANGQAAATYADHLGEVSRQIAKRRGIDSLGEELNADAVRVAANEAQRVRVATAGMDAKKRAAWLERQTDMTPGERAFYAEHCAYFEAIAEQDGGDYANAVLRGSINEALFAKAGWRFGHDADGRITSITSKDGQTWKMRTENRRATIEDFSDKTLVDFIAEFNANVDDGTLKDAKGNKEKKFAPVSGKADLAAWDEAEVKRLNAALGRTAGWYDEDGITLFLGNTQTGEGTVAHEVTHALIEKLGEVHSREARRNMKGLALMLGGNWNEGTAVRVGNATQGAADAQNEGARPDEINWRGIGKNALEAAKRVLTLGLKKGEWEAAIKRAENGEGIDPSSHFAKVLAEATQVLRRHQELEARQAAERKAVGERFKQEREAKRQAKIKARAEAALKAKQDAGEKWDEKSAEAQKILDQVDAEIAQEEQAALDEIDRRYEDEFKKLEDEEVANEIARKEQERMEAQMFKNRKDALKEPPRLGHAKNQDGEAAQRSRASYIAMWKAKTGKKVSQEEVDRIGEEYGLPPEALNLVKGKGGWNLSNKQILSNDALNKLSDGLVRFWGDVKSVKVIVPDVVVGSEAEAKNVLPNEVYDPVSDTFIEGRVVVDAANAKSFREQAGLADEHARRFSISPADAASDPAARAYADAVKRGDANARTTRLAPNGKRSNLSNALYHLVRTRRFKDWFGDWEVANLFNLATKAWNDKSYIGKFVFVPSQKLGDKLKDLLGHEINEVVITADSVRHMKNNHGDAAYEAARGQVAMTPEDVAVLPYVLNNFDDAVREPTYDLRDGNKAVTIYKRINGVSIATTISKGKDKQFVVSGWKLVSTGSMPQNVTPNLNALSDVDVGIVQKEIAEIKRAAKDCSKVVDENGEPLVAAHRTGADFTVFSKRFAQDREGRRIGLGLGKGKFYLSAQSGEEYKAFYDNQKVMRLFVNANKLMDEEEYRRRFEEMAKDTPSAIPFNEGYDYKRRDAIIERIDKQIRKEGYDGIWSDVTGQLAVFSPEQIKSADPVTYDDAGNVIPLSQRFDANNSDIRFSISQLYTGSAADYEKPSLLKVGTGEGSQVYGWGLYASTERGGAETYVGRYNQTRNLLYKDKEIDVGSMVFPRNATPEELALKFGRSTGSVKGAISAMEYEAGKDRTYAKKFREAISWMKNHKDDFKENEHSPMLYEQTFFTNRAPGDESHLLKWYEPVSEENAKRVIDAILSIGRDEKEIGYELGNDWKEQVKNGNGRDAYQTVVSMFSNEDLITAGKLASELLARADIDGIKYPVDSYGKTVKDGDTAGWNYVSFRDDNIRVDHKWVDGVRRFSISQADAASGDISNDAEELERISQKFDDDIQRQIDGALPDGYVYDLGRPGNVLLSTGIPDLPIQLNAAKLKLKSEADRHKFNLEEVKGLVKMLRSPIAVFAYGDKSKAQNVVIDIQHGGKNFIVGMSLRPVVNGNVLDINSIRTVYQKDNHEWMNWINQGKLLYVDKSKIQVIFRQHQMNAGDVPYFDLDSAQIIAQNFDNPQVGDSENQSGTDRSQKETKKLGTQFRGKPSSVNQAPRIMPNGAGSVKGVLTASVAAPSPSTGGTRRMSSRASSRSRRGAARG